MAGGIALAGPVVANAATQAKVKATPKVVERVVAFDSGQIVDVPVEVGDTVVANAVIIQLEEDDHRHRYELAKLRLEDDSSLRKAQAKVEQQRARLEATRERHRRRQVSDYALSEVQAETSAAQADYDRAIISQKMAKLELERATEALKKRRLRAPISGVVLEVSKSRGDMIGKGTVVARIGDPNEVTLSVNLPQKLLAALKEAGSVPLTLADGRVVQTQVESVGGAVKGHPELREVVLAPLTPNPELLSLTEPMDVGVPTDPSELPPAPSPVPDPIMPRPGQASSGAIYPKAGF